MPKKVSIQTAAFVFLFFSTAACIAQDSISNEEQQVVNGLLPLVAEKSQFGRPAIIADRLKRYGVPGISIAVVDDGKVAWARGFGSLAIGGDTKVDIGTLFQAASNSKPVASVGALALVSRGKVSLDEPVNARLSSWKIPANNYSAERDVTLRHLLSHGAGMSVSGFRGYAVGEQLPSLLQILNGERPANSPPIVVNAPVGKEWRYSGGGYTVVQQLIADVSGEPFSTFMRETVLSPLGMTSSSFDSALSPAQQERTATGHYGGGQAVEGGHRIYPELAAAGLWSTPSDLAKFVIGVQQAHGGKSSAILRKSEAEELLRKQMESEGLGFAVFEQRGNTMFAKDGINAGFDSRLMAYTTLGKGVVVMTNSNLSSGLIWEIIDSVAKVYGWPGYEAHEQREYVPQAPDYQRSLAGKYELGPGRAMSVTWLDGSLKLEIPSQGRTEIFASISSGEYFILGLDFPPFSFERDANGRTTAMLVGPPGQQQRYPRQG